MISPPASNLPTTPVASGVDGKKVILPIAPTLDPAIVAMLQGKKYPEAIAVLNRLGSEAKEPATKAYLALLRGKAMRLAGQTNEARAAWDEAIKVEPEGPWSAKLRFELAGLELAAGRPAEAEVLARVDATRLLAGPRKDRLAGVYLAFARRLLKPEDPITPPDPNSAYTLLGQARDLAKGDDLLAQIRLDLARAAQSASNFPQAIADYRAYLKGNKATERPAALYAIGECQLALGASAEARKTWTDLAAELEKHPESSEIRAKSLYQVAKTREAEPDKRLAITAYKAFLAAYPAHPWAVPAAYRVAEIQDEIGEGEQALAAYRGFLAGEGFKVETDDARRDYAARSMTATFQIGAELRDEEKFEEAIAAWQTYLTKYPNGPQSSQAQVQQLETRLLIAEEAIRVEDYPKARETWTTFIAQNPLDSRVEDLLFRIGASYLTQKDFDKAITSWEALISKYPEGDASAHAQLEIGGIEENTRGNLPAAIERYKKSSKGEWAAQAQVRIAVMNARALVVVTPKTFRSGETPQLKIATRNLESLTFRAYKIGPEAYFRKKNLIGAVESLDIGLVAADAEWTMPVPGFAKYKPIDTNYDLKVKAPGVWVVKVSDETHLQATTLVLGSDIDAVIKTSRDQLLVFAQDMKTGKGRPNARVLVSDGSSVILEKKTGPDGVLLANWDKPLNPDAGLRYLVLDGPDAAGSTLAIPSTVARGLSARAYLYTDRPAYRPGQAVEIRGIVREIKEGQYDDPAGASYKLEVIDARGRPIVERLVVLSAFGTFHESLPLDEGAPVGAYRIRLYQPGRSEFAGAFQVQSYRLEKVDLAFDLPQTVFFRGERVKADLVARYQYGAPLAGRPIRVELGDGRSFGGTTDATGRFHLEFATNDYAEEQTIPITAQLTADNVAAATAIAIRVKAFELSLTTTRDTFLDGETFRLVARASDPFGKPVAQSLKLSVLRKETRHERSIEREVSTATLATDAATGEGSVPVTIADKEGASYILRASGTDRFGNVVFSDRAIEISGKNDPTKLRFLADRVSYKVGEEARVNLNSRSAAGTALVAWEADRVIQYRIVEVKDGDNALTWAVEGPQFPNFTLTASRMAGDRFDEARLDVRVERDLRLTIKPKSPTSAPGGEIEVEIAAADQSGRPVAAELSLSLVDKSLLRIYADGLPPIGEYFYNQARLGAFSAGSTNTFAYHPQTEPVAQAVVEDASQHLARLKDSETQDQARQNAQSFNLALPATAAPAPMMPNAPGQVAEISADSFGEPGDRMAARKPSSAAGGMGGGRMAGEAVGLDAPAGLAVTREDKAEDAKSEVGLSRESEMAGKFKRGYLGRARGGQGQAANEPRQRFVETAYWNPSVVTGTDGKATLKFKAPEALSDYRLTARGTTGSDTLVGQATADLVVKKDFFVDLRLPDTLTQGDRPRFVAEIHHVGVRGPASLGLTIYTGGRQVVDPRVVELKSDGVTEVAFDAFEVPEGESVKLTLKAQVGTVIDEMTADVPTRPWGVQAYATASGTSSDGATVFVGLPPGRAYDNPEMLVTVAPTLRRLLVELALDEPVRILPYESSRVSPCPPLPLTIADRASELLAASAVLGYLKTTRSDAAPEAERLTSRVRGIAAELVTLQNPDGGWPWVAPGTKVARPQASDRMTSAAAGLALAAARDQAMLADPAAFERAVRYLLQETGRIEAADTEMKAMFAHALAAMHRGSFEGANALNRARQGLSDAALAAVALTFAELDRASLADEALDLLATRARSEPAAPGQPPRTYWGGENQRWNRGSAETTALVAQAFAQIRPAAKELPAAIEWLLAHRAGNGWSPRKARGPALAALSSFYGRAKAAEDRYRLVVTVNDLEVFRAEVDGAADGKAIPVPRRAIRVGDRNRIRFDVEGRGTFGYSVALTGFSRDLGPEQDAAGKPFYMGAYDILPATPEFEGKPVATGFTSAINPKTFVNRATQVAQGGRARVELRVDQRWSGGRNDWERDFLVVESPLPAGTTLIEGSVRSNAANFTAAEGLLTLYFPPGILPGTIDYEIAGYLPGQYRVAPTRVRSAYDPSKQHLGAAYDLKVLSPGEASTDAYQPTPDELLARGKALHDLGRLSEAAGPLEALSNGYTLRDDVLKDVARMLLTIHIKDYQPKKIVADFEILKEKAPELVIPFDEVSVVGRAYRDIGEPERATLVWRAIVESSYIDDAQVGETLRQRGRSLEAIVTLLDLWREYPGTASIDADLFGVSQLLAVEAGRAFNNAPIRDELLAAGVTRSQLLLQAIRINGTLLALAPTSPYADEISLAQLGDFLELEDFEAVVRRAGEYAATYPKSKFFDSFQFSEALGRFNLGQYDRAIELAGAIRKATYKDANGVDQESPNKWQAVYILGQIHDARRQPAQAVAYYKEVADRFADAAGAVKGLTRKALKLPEVSILRPIAKPAPAGERASVTLDYRNIADADVKVYPVDLMRLYLTRRNLDAIASIDLAGITPLVETVVKLGDGEDYADKNRAIPLPLDKEGAYLVMARGENLYASGIVLVTPLELEVLEEVESGRVRVSVRDARTKDPVPKISVKVIGTQNPTFLSGTTDLRGVFVAEGVRGEVTAIARREPGQYAFYRGKTFVGAPLPSLNNNWATPHPANAPASLGADLQQNLKSLNSSNQVEQLQRLENRYRSNPKGIRAQDAR